MYGVEANQTEYPTTTSEEYLIKGSNCSFADCIQNTTTSKTQQQNVGMHSDVYEPLSVKLGMTIATSELYITVPV